MIDARTALALLLLPGVGRKTAQGLIEQGLSGEEAPGSIMHVLGDSKHRRLRAITEEDVSLALASADRQVLESRRLAIRILLRGDRDFPVGLTRVPEPPLMIHVLGGIESFHLPGVAIVGTRRPSEFARESSYRLGSLAVNAGFCVVSGLALGCDSSAHEGALAANGRTVAVLAHGLETVHPKKNQMLADQIVGAGGCLVSEYAVGTKPIPAFFVERDRLQVGFGNGVVVVQTTSDGGSMHAVRCAAEAGVPVGVVLPPADAIPNSWEGNQQLIESGNAHPLSDQTSVEEFFRRCRTRVPRAAPADMVQENLDFEDG